MSGDEAPIQVVETQQQQAPAAAADAPAGENKAESFYFKDFVEHISRIKAMPLKKNKYGGESVPLLLDGIQRVLVQFPKLTTTWGFNEFKGLDNKAQPGGGAAAAPATNPDGSEKKEDANFSVGLDVDIESSNPTIRAFIEFVKALENHARDLAVAHRAQWMPSEDGEDAVIRALFRPIIVKPKPDKQGLPKITMSVPKGKESDFYPFGFGVRVFLPNNVQVPVHPKNITPGSQVITMGAIDCISFWGGRPKVKIVPDHFVVWPAPRPSTNCAIVLDRDDEDFVENAAKRQKTDA